MISLYFKFLKKCTFVTRYVFDLMKILIKNQNFEKFVECILVSRCQSRQKITTTQMKPVIVYNVMIWSSCDEIFVDAHIRRFRLWKHANEKILKT